MVRRRARVQRGPAARGLVRRGLGGKPDISNALALLSVKDATRGQAWFEQVRGDQGEQRRRPRTYAGTTLTALAKRQTGRDSASAIVDGKVAVLGDSTSVKAAIDTKGAGVAATTRTPRPLGAASGDHLGFVYVDLGASSTGATSRGCSLGSGSGSREAAGLGQAMRRVRCPAWRADWRCAVEATRASSEAHRRRRPRPSGRPRTAPPTSPSTLPATTIALSVSHDYGQDPPAGRSTCTRRSRAQGRHRAPSTRAAWLGGARQRPRLDRRHRARRRTAADTPSRVGIVIRRRPTRRRPTASSRASRACVRSAATGGLTFSEQDHGGTTIMIVSHGHRPRRAAIGAGVRPCSRLPVDDIELAWAVDATTSSSSAAGPAFVEHVLDTDRGVVPGRCQPVQGPHGPGRQRHGLSLRRHRGRPRRHRGLREERGPSALKSYESRCQAVPRPARRARRVALGRGRRWTDTTVIITVK